MQFIPSSNKKWYPSHSVVKVWWFQPPPPTSSYQSRRHPQFWYTCSIPHRLIKGLILSSSLSINSGHELLSNHSHILSKPFPVYLFLHKGQITTLSNFSLIPYKTICWFTHIVYFYSDFNDLLNFDFSVIHLCNTEVIRKRQTNNFKKKCPCHDLLVDLRHCCNKPRHQDELLPKVLHQPDPFQLFALPVGNYVEEPGTLWCNHQNWTSYYKGKYL